MRECQEAPHGPQGAHVLEHEVRFIPLDVMCRTTDGRLFASPVVPSWLNPALASSFAGTAIFTAGAFVQANRRASARNEDRGGSGPGKSPRPRSPQLPL